VEFAGDFFLLKPVDLEKGNHRLLFDVNNRGNLVVLRFFNNAPRNNNPSTAEDAGNGFLMERGYSLLSSAWDWDVTPDADRLQIDLPIATKNGRPITQKINVEPNVLIRETLFMRLFPAGTRGYEPVDPEDRTATLTVRNDPMGERTEIPRDRWCFARVEDGKVVTDPAYVYLEDRFQPGKLYELVYTAKDPKVVGLGFAAVRDAVSFFHFETEDHEGTLNPLAVSNHGKATEPDPEFAMAVGLSQSGRAIAHMLFEGFHVDEKDRMVFEGAWPYIAGGGKGGFNSRFAQTTQGVSQLVGYYFPVDHFPFNYNRQYDPVSGQTGDILEVAKKKGKIPYIFITNHAAEYWMRSASLIHTDVNGMEDAMPINRRKIRMYLVNGAPHGSVVSRTSPECEHGLSTVDTRPVARALLVALDAWITDGTPPPDNAIPRISKGELITSKEHQRRFPKIPGMRHPGVSLAPPRVDYGPRFWIEGIQDKVPPETIGPPYVTLVPSFDADGNGIGGIRLPDLAVPLGTYQGWNPRRKEVGASNYLGRLVGSFWMFPRTEEEREKTGDPRPSIEARYPTQQEYVRQEKASTQELLEKGFLLEQDRQELIRRARNLAWPPEPIDKPPFWKMKN
jgi:hypothetical protein